MREDQSRDAQCQKTTLAVGRAKRRAAAAQQQQAKKREQNRRADVARLLRPDAEDEVVHRNRLRQVLEVVRLALADALARKTTGPDGDLRLPEVVARAEPVLLGKEKDPHAVELMRLQGHVAEDLLAARGRNARTFRLIDGAEHRKRRESSDKDDRHQSLPPDASRKQHHENGRNQRQGRAKLGLGQDEQRRNADQRPRQQKSAERRPNHSNTRTGGAEQDGRQDNHAQLRHLTRLEEPEPPPASKLLRAENQDRDEQEQRDDIRRKRNETARLPIIRQGDQKIKNQAETGRHKIRDPPPVEDGLHAGVSRAADRDRADCDQDNRHGQRQPVKPLPPSSHFRKASLRISAAFGAAVTPPDSPFSTIRASATVGASEGA